MLFAGRVSELRVTEGCMSRVCISACGVSRVRISDCGALSWGVAGFCTPSIGIVGSCASSFDVAGFCMSSFCRARIAHKYRRSVCAGFVWKNVVAPIENCAPSSVSFTNPDPNSTRFVLESTAFVRRVLMFCTMLQMAGKRFKSLLISAFRCGMCAPLVTSTHKILPSCLLMRNSAWRSKPVCLSSS